MLCLLELSCRRRVRDLSDRFEHLVWHSGGWIVLSQLYQPRQFTISRDASQLNVCTRTYLPFLLYPVVTSNLFLSADSGAL